MTKKIAAFIGLIFILSGVSQGPALACTEYVHIWKPVSEKMSNKISSHGIALLLKKILKQLPRNEKQWCVCVNPVSKMPEAVSAALASSVLMLENRRLINGENISPFNAGSQGIAALWLDFVSPERIIYCWQDTNKPPMAMFRTGEMDTAVVRVMARNSKGKIVLIEEFKHLFLLESDFMLPGWIGVASGWMRRLSYQIDFAENRVEYTFSIPPDQEAINATPENISRFYIETADN
jgi:hypothetical protein